MPDSILLVKRPCVKCGATDRYKTGACKACSILAAKKWRSSNQEKSKAISAAWYAANREEEATRRAARYAANPEKTKIANAAWNTANPGRKKASSAARYAANPERQNAISAAWYAANTNKVRSSQAAWRAANPEARRVYGQNRRAREQANGGTLSRGLAEKLFKLQKGKCACCQQPLGKDYHLDHRMPLALGGSNTDDNMQLLRKLCNLQKNAKHPIDFMQSRGFLL